MFKNCCGCPGKKAVRKESEEEEDDNKSEKEDNKVLTCEVEVDQPKNAETAKSIAQVEIPKIKENFSDIGLLRPKASSMKKPKPRLSISTEVKIIPSNFPEDYDDAPFEEENEPTKEEGKKDEDEEEEEDTEVIKIPVKNIDGKVIRRSVSEENSRRASEEEKEEKGEKRAVSPLSDEVFVANEKSHLELPLHNLGVKLDTSPLPGKIDLSGSPKKPSLFSQKRVSMPAVLPKWLSEEEETGGSQEPPVTPVSR